MPKKPKLTPEEKKALKAQKAAERKRLAELKRRQLRHDYLSREIQYGELTVKRHEKKWKEMLVKISLPRMRADLQFAWHNFERIIDSKDFTISLLMDEIKAAEEQYMMNLRCHSENIDSLIIRFRDRLIELKQDSEAQIEAMRASAEDEIEEIKETAAESDEYLKTMLFGLEMAKKEQEKRVRGDYLSKIDEETTKYSDIIQNLRAGLERTFTKLWDDIKNFLKNYTTQTEERRKAYIMLSQQDTNLQKICSQQQIKLQDMQESIKKLKQQYASLQETEEQKIADLIQERQYFADAFWTLRTRLVADRALDASNLQILTVESNEATAFLKQIKKKGERLLELAAVCRKLETQEEKILPFPLRSSDGIKVAHSDIKIDEYKNTSNLYLFWDRVAQADAVRHSINEEREFLRRENKILKMKIHSYCQCLECPIEETRSNKPNTPGKNINVVDGYQFQRSHNKH
ncbi:hypothetical protein ILUMI_26361 [Ignelater luminosus]|uniref:Dynein regulatory complex subunit 2 n=1 Tax=Ignelater luminosus TaxID=2038154 RepID=A0A8K0C4G4_IGNLU|nr:hypothetical protein ILUMI_26361 [Ignelater luminosus]